MQRFHYFNDICVYLKIFGIVAAGLGIWITLDDPSFMHFTHLDELELFDTSYVKTSSYVIIAGGFAMSLFGVLGIVAAATGSLILLATVSTVYHRYVDPYTINVTTTLVE